MFTEVKKTSSLIPCLLAFRSNQIRHRTSKFKPRIAKHRPLKTPTALALDHFDFYYGPLFGKKWPSVRLGLLTPHKYIAVVNIFSVSSDASEAILRERGASNLITDLLELPPSSSSSAKMQDFNEENSTERKEDTLIDDELENLKKEDIDSAPRDELGLHTFQPSNKTYTLGELQRGTKRRNIVITGFEGQGCEVPKRKHIIEYPKNLKLYVYPRNDLTDFPSPDKDSLGVPTWWLLDGGSVVPVLALDLKKGETMLDMCAAPGGKSLLAAQTLLLDRLVCNDAKISRLGQLRQALASFIPNNLDIADRIILKKKDASDLLAWNELDAYDKVLVDAPCTTDRLSVNVDENNIFSTSMTTERLNLPQLQTKLLINGLRSVRRGGSVVYSTCSLSPVQNEVVVENALAIASEQFGIKAVELSLSQLVADLRRLQLYEIANCRVGSIVLPFLPSNFGPMYFCKLQRIS